MTGKLYLLNGTSIIFDENTIFEDLSAGTSKEELLNTYYSIMDNGNSPSIEVIRPDKIYLFPRKSICHFELDKC